MECSTFSHINKEGRKVYKPKLAFNTLDDAIAECKKLNARPKQITKLVSYKCKTCHKYHIGRNGKTLTDKYKKKLSNAVPKPTFKIIGKINLK